MRKAMLGIGVVAGITVLGALLLDEGEVVTLITHEGERSFATQVWIVEFDGREYLRAGDSERDWLLRIRENPEVGIRRGHDVHDRVEGFYARLADPALGPRVNAAMQAKYGAANRMFCRFNAHREIPIVLEPIPSDVHARAGRGPERSP